MPSNHELAMSRLRFFVSKIKRQSNLMEKYDIIRDQLDKGVIEKKLEVMFRTERNIIFPPCCNYPTEINYKKGRVVYDASAKSKQRNKSFNGCLYRGPVMINDICGILIRFRLHSTCG